jgi:hypothetical protein
MRESNPEVAADRRPHHHHNDNYSTVSCDLTIFLCMIERYCKCGCGNKILLLPRNTPGRYPLYLPDHSTRSGKGKMARGELDRPCACGCGQMIIQRREKGQSPPRKVLPGHRSAAATKLEHFLEEQKGKPCADCGRSFPTECMDFDHLPEFIKLMTPRKLYKNMEMCLAEIAKCEIVCACCHRTRTRKRCTESRELFLTNLFRDSFRDV